VAEVDRDVRASVEVIANESISTYLLPPALGEVRRRWPNMRFAVTVGMCPRITAGLSTGRYDVGLMLQTPRCPPTEPDESPDSRRVLSHVSLLLFASPAHPLASGGDVPREALPPYTVFVSDARGYFHDLVRDFFRSDGVPMPRLEPTGSVEAVKQSVITDPRGVGVLPAYALGAELDAGTLCAIDVRPALPRVRLEAMLYRTRAPAHPAVTTLLDELRASLHDADTETSDVWPARRSADAEPLRPRL